MNITLKPIYLNPTAREVLSGQKRLGLLYAPQSPGDKWAYWPKLPDLCLQAPVSSDPVCQFDSEAEAIRFLGVQGAEAVRT